MGPTCGKVWQGWQGVAMEGKVWQCDAKGARCGKRVARGARCGKGDKALAAQK